MMKRFRFLLIAVLCAPLGLAARAQVPGPSDADLNVQLFLRSFYPDLFQRPITLASHVEGMQRQVSVKEGSIDPLQASTAAPLIEASFQLDGNDTIREFNATGPYLNEGPNPSLPFTTSATADVGIALGTVDQAPDLGPERLPRLPRQIDVARGNGRPLRPISTARKQSGDRRYSFLWAVTVEIGDTKKKYLLMFEPLNGRLVSMVER